MYLFLKNAYVNLMVFNITTELNEPETLTTHVLYQCKCKFDGRKCNSNQNWNNNKCQSECKSLSKHNLYIKDYIWNSSKYTYENGKCLENLIGDSVINCDEITMMTKTVLAKSISIKNHSSKRYYSKF